MKTTLKFILMIFALSSAPFLAVATEDAQAEEPEYDLPTYEFIDIVTLPKPRRSPIPSVKSHLVGLKLKVRLTVTELGRPENVRLEKPLSSYSDLDKMTFANQILEMMSKWSFNPARDANNKPVAIQIIMPVRVVKYGKVYKALASVELDTEKEDKS